MLRPKERASKMNEIDFGQLTAILVRAHHTNHLCRPHRNDDLLQTKIIKGVYKKHLHGLLFKLDMLYVWRNTITVKNNFEALPDLVSSVPDSSITIDVNPVRDNDRHRKRRYYINIHNSPTHKKPLTRECKTILNTLSSELLSLPSFVMLV